MTDSTPTRRATRRNMATQPIPREQGAKTAGQRIRFNPINPVELAWILGQARAQRTEEDIAEYKQRSKRCKQQF